MKKAGFVIKQLVKMLSQAVILPLWYTLFRWQKTDERLVVFADAHNHAMPYSMKLIHERFEAEGYRICDMFSDYGRDSFFVTFKNMLAFTKMYARAKYVIICDYFLPASAPSVKKGTKVVQLWHACGIFKRFAYEAQDDIPKYYKCRVIKNYSLVTVSSPQCVPVYSRAMQLESGIVRSTGVSRTDVYFSESYREQCCKRFYEQYPEARGKKIVLWAPTFRGNAAIPYLEGKEDVLRLRQELPEDWFLLIRLHPHFHDHDISCDISTEELLPVIDMLISDYSTVIFEYSLFLKPLVLFAPDYDVYGSKRGFYIDYKTLPGRIVTDKDRLSEAILEEYNGFDWEKMKEFRDKYMSGCDGRATDRIFRLLTTEGGEQIEK